MAAAKRAAHLRGPLLQLTDDSLNYGLIQGIWRKISPSDL
jgi:hypothetical protein